VEDVDVAEAGVELEVGAGVVLADVVPVEDSVDDADEVVAGTIDDVEDAVSEEVVDAAVVGATELVSVVETEELEEGATLEVSVEASAEVEDGAEDVAGAVLLAADEEAPAALLKVDAAFCNCQ